MPVSDSEYKEALREVSEYLDSLNIEIVGDIDAEQDGHSIDGFVIQGAGRKISIWGTKAHEWFEVRHEFDVRGEFMEIHKIENSLQEQGIKSDEEVRAALNDGIEVNLEDVSHDDFVSAASNKIEQIDHDKLNHTLTTQLSDEDNIFTVLNTNGIIHGFSIARRAFVYEDSFSMSDLFSIIQSIVNDTIVPTNLLADAYGTQKIDPNRAGEGSGIEPSDDPAFR
jgi:hypothetical protein